MDSSKQDPEVIRAFDRGAAQYRETAVVQERVARCLAERVAPCLNEGMTALDLGAGVGFLSEQLLAHEPQLSLHALDASRHMLSQLPASDRITAVHADFDRIPFPDGHFDLVVSSAALQWSSGTEQSLREWLRVLRPGGWLHVATFTAGTLQEWAEAWKRVDHYQHVNTLTAGDDVEAILRGLPSQSLRVSRETETLYFPTYKAALHSVRAIGANRVQNRRERRKGLSGKKAWQAFEAEYEKMRTEEGLPLSYQVFYGSLQK